MTGMSGSEQAPDPAIEQLTADYRELAERVDRLVGLERSAAESARSHRLARTSQAAIGPIVLLAIGLFAPFIEVHSTDDDSDAIDHFSILGLLRVIVVGRARVRDVELTGTGVALVVALLLVTAAAITAGITAAASVQSSSKAARRVGGWAVGIGVIAMILVRILVPGNESDLDVSLEFGVIVLLGGFLWAAVVAESEAGSDGR